MKRCYSPQRVLPLVCLALLSGCGSVAYYAQAARGHLDLMSRRVPIDAVLESEDVAQDLKSKLQLAVEARSFASAQLALPDNDSYRMYADLERSQVLWNVFATPEFSIDAKVWCYWFVGCLGYRGYFSQAQADAVGARLSVEGYDVFVGGVAAYSTLGRFADPLLNTMLDRSVLYIPEIMFHELTHQRVYRAGDSEFSESLASFVQQEGVFRWLESRADREGQIEYRAALSRENDFVDLLNTAREKLRMLYAQPFTPEAMRAHKKAVFERLRDDYVHLKISQWNGYAGYDGWFEQALNNAHLVSVSTYHRLIPAFRVVLKDVNGDMEVFFDKCEELAQMEDAPLQAELQRLLLRAAHN